MPNELTTSSTIAFRAAKQRFLHFAHALERADSAHEFRALLLADVTAPYHSFDMLQLLTVAECIGEKPAELMSEGLDAQGVPEDA